MLTPRLRRLVVSSIVLVMAARAGTVTVQDFEGRPSFGRNRHTFGPAGRPEQSYVDTAATGKWALRLAIPACSSGFWQMTGQPGPAWAEAKPTHLVFWHRAVGSEAKFRVVLREEGGERWVRNLVAKPGEWHQESIPLAEFTCVGGGTSDRVFQLDRMKVFQLQWDKVETKMVLEVDGICLTDRPEQAKSDLEDIPEDRLAFQRDGEREVANLGGTWGFQPADAIGDTPPSDGWQIMEIPKEDAWKRNHWGKYRKEWAKAKCGWYRRRFVVPKADRPRCLRLHFGAVHAEAEIWLNGRKIGRHVGGLTPFELPIMDLPADGACELVVGCRSSLAKTEPQPLGAMHRFHAGIWQKVELLALPLVHVADVFVLPSVREQRLRAQVTVRNTTGTEQKVSVGGQVFVSGQTKAPVLALPANTVAVPAGQERVVALSVPWADAHYWSFEDPFLYDLAVSLNGQLATTTRFGFREFWVDGEDFRLNGHKVRLKATWGHSGEWYYGRPSTIRETLKVMREHNLNCVRFHGQPLPPAFLDAADEVGMMVVAESGLYHSPVHENSLVHTREWVLRDRNHPAIVIWSGSNEFGHWIVPRNPEKTEFLLRQQALIHELDPTRPVMQHGYGPMDGKEEIYNIHYPERALGMLPNCFRWPTDPSVEINPHYYDFHQRPRTPLAIGEHLLGTGGKQALFVGDRDYGLGRDWEYAGRFFGVAMDEYRLQNVAHVAPQVFQSSSGGKSVPNPYLDSLRHAFRPEGVFRAMYCSHFRTGEPITLPVAIYNETLRDQDYRLTCRWSGPDGTEGEGDPLSLRLVPGDVLRRTVSFPSVPTPGNWTASFQLVRQNDEVVDQLNVPCRVFPRDATVSLTGTVGVYGDDPATLAALNQSGVRARRVELTEANLKGLRTLVVARGAVTDEIVSRAQVVESFVRAGGRVLCLEQNAMPRWLPVPVRLCGAKSSPTETVAFAASAVHPPTQGCGLDSFRFWRNDHVVTTRSLEKPVQGNFRPLVSSSLDLARAPLLELPVGKGTYVVCQLDLIRAFSDEPMARMSLANLLSWLDRRPAGRMRGGICLAAADSPLTRYLQEDLKADVKLAGAAKVGDLVLLDASALRTMGGDKARELADSGVTLFVQDADETCLPEISALVGGKAQLVKAETKSLRLVRDRELTLGLTNFDLAWQASNGRDLDPARLGVRLVLDGVQTEQFCETPGVLQRLKVGEGEVILNQLRFPAVEYDGDKARRTASILFTNLGLNMRSLSLLPVNEKGWFFADLRPFCNSRLKADHGNDLRNLPTGQTELAGVPFYVIPHDQNNGMGAISLSNVQVLPDGSEVGRRGDKPTEIKSIVIRHRVGRLAFLHMAGFSHKLSRYRKPRIAEYVVNYRNGGRDVIPVRESREVVNWWTDWAQDLPNAKLAWKGANLRTDKVAVFMVEWVNPFPEREVESVDFRSCANPAWGPTLIAVSGLEIE
jgi:hypothetical protein